MDRLYSPIGAIGRQTVTGRDGASPALLWSTSQTDDL